MSHPRRTPTPLLAVLVFWAWLILCAVTSLAFTSRATEPATDLAEPARSAAEDFELHAKRLVGAVAIPDLCRGVATTSLRGFATAGRSDSERAVFEEVFERAFASAPLEARIRIDVARRLAVESELLASEAGLRRYATSDPIWIAPSVFPEPDAAMLLALRGSVRRAAAELRRAALLVEAYLRGANAALPPARRLSGAEIRAAVARAGETLATALGEERREAASPELIGAAAIAARTPLYRAVVDAVDAALRDAAFRAGAQLVASTTEAEEPADIAAAPGPFRE